MLHDSVEFGVVLELPIQDIHEVSLPGSRRLVHAESDLGIVDSFSKIDLEFLELIVGLIEEHLLGVLEEYGLVVYLSGEVANRSLRSWQRRVDAEQVDEPELAAIHLWYHLAAEIQVLCQVVLDEELSDLDPPRFFVVSHRGTFAEESAKIVSLPIRELIQEFRWVARLEVAA